MPAPTAARRGFFFVGGWSAEVMVQFSSRVPLKGGDVEVEEGEEDLEEVDTARSEEEEAEKANKTDDTW